MTKDINFLLWSRIHRLSPYFRERWQFSELRRVVRSAYEHVPMYRELWKSAGVKPEDIKTVVDIRRVPAVTKEIMRRFPLEEKMHDSFPSGAYGWGQTSGSTGEPFRFLASYFYTRAFPDSRYPHFCWFRFLIWRGMSLDYIRRKLRVAQVSVGSRPKGGAYLHVPMNLMREDPAEMLARLRTFGPEVVESMATMLVELARIAEQIPARERPRFPYALAYGEMLMPAQRAYIEEIFGCEVYNRYGLFETGGVGIDCKEHNGFHINEESFIVEVVDNKGNSLPAGSQGRIIVTYFYNDVMPFIRYATDDIGMILQDICPCGLRARRLVVDGRIGGFIYIGGRKFNHIELEMTVSRYARNILQYQLVKTGNEKLEFRMIPASKFLHDDIEELFSRFKKEFTFVPTVRQVSQIRPLSSGKISAILDETNHPATD